VKGKREMNKTSRRDFIQFSGLALAASSLAALPGQTHGQSDTKKEQKSKLTIGLASYTFRKFPLENCIAMTKRLGLTKVTFKDMHLPLDSTPEQIRATVAKVNEAGIDLYGCGVVYMKNEAEVNQAFEYAKAAGMKKIIGVPEHSLLELVNQKVQQYDIMLAIHNHGPGDKRYPSPQSVYEKVKNLDKRIGLCMDIGHTQRIGVDPSKAALAFADRLYDVHIKDVSEASEKGFTVEIGRGVIDIPKFLKTLLKIKYSGVIALEYEKDAEDPLAGAAESIGYLKGALTMI